MGRLENVKATINANIKNNGKQAITGSILNSVMTEMVDATDAELTKLSEETNTKFAEFSEEVDALQKIHETLDVTVEKLVTEKVDSMDYAPNLSVGVADQLAGQDEPTPSEINFRRSGGGAILDGNARIEAIKGNSVVWNQVYPTDWSLNALGFSLVSSSNVISVSGTATENFIRFNRFAKNDANHIYLFDLSGASANLNGKTLALANRRSAESPNIINGYASIIYHNIKQELQNDRFIVIRGITIGDVINEPNLVIRQIDLTQMFGAGNEPMTIEEFYARKPIVEDEYAYNEGEVIHMDVQNLESVGVNQWDEEWELGIISTNGVGSDSTTQIRSKNFNRLISGQSYNITCSDDVGQIILYDKDKNFVDYFTLLPRILEIPTNVRFFKLTFLLAYGTTYNHDICINLSDTSINGKYFPYVKRMQSLDIIRKYFPDGMKSAGSAHDEIRYNKVTQKWEAVQRIGGVDMGSLVVSYSPTNSLFIFPVEGMNLPVTYDDRKSGILCSRYTISNDVATASMSDKSMLRFLDGNVYIKDTSYTDVASFKADLQGVMLYYELAEPIVTELDFDENLDYQVWNGGTEKAIAEGQSAPLKADIVYGFNAYGVIKQLKEQIAQMQAQMAQMAQMAAMVSQTSIEE